VRGQIGFVLDRLEDIIDESPRVVFKEIGKTLLAAFADLGFRLVRLDQGKDIVGKNVWVCV
jgi:hypothetical protein